MGHLAPNCDSGNGEDEDLLQVTAAKANLEWPTSGEKAVSFDVANCHPFAPSLSVNFPYSIRHGLLLILPNSFPIGQRRGVQ